jgi:2,4-dienoyl-CoA reductase-like NADH-dependent reductase (Old Yellow Enzyme family)
MNADALFTPFNLKTLHLKNRFVMAPMTRSFSPDGVPPAAVAEYYRKRAAGEVGLILSEGTVVDRPAASADSNIPRFHGEAAFAGWRQVVDAVHLAGGRMGPQIWHQGVVASHRSGWLPPAPFEGPSGLLNGSKAGVAMSIDDIEATIAAFARAAADAKRLGFDTVEIHGAHAYLIDQFFWERTNQRTDQYGGKTLAQRSRFAVELVQAVRRAVGEDFPIILRLSQWKIGDYDYRLAQTPQEMAAWLEPLAAAGVDIFHCSQRRFWLSEFPDSDLNFAGWAKKLTGKATITVGSVGLHGDFINSFRGEGATGQSIDVLLHQFQRGDFDLVAVGRALISDPNWVLKAKGDRLDQFAGFEASHLGVLA